MFGYSETVVRLRAPLVADPYSGAATLRDWVNAARLPIEGCAVNPGGSVESQSVDRAPIVSTPSLLAPYGADVVAGDRIESESGVWDVQGHGAQWRSPLTGHEFGSVFPLRRSDG